MICPVVIMVNAAYVMGKRGYIYKTTDPFNLSHPFQMTLIKEKRQCAYAFEKKKAE